MPRLHGKVPILLISFMIKLSALQAAAGRKCNYISEDENIARYLFELWNNRQRKCESGGDFLRDPEDISYNVESVCQTIEADGIALITASYTYKNCESRMIEPLSLSAAVRNCEENGNNSILNPFKYSIATVRKMPVGYACKPGFEEVMIESDPDLDFTREWEFRHAVENVYKYGNDTDTGSTLATIPGCNAYVSTRTDKACYNSINNQYQGYATIKVECVANGETEEIPVYIDGNDLGRTNCPWPEILENSPGYDSNFNFVSIGASAAGSDEYTQGNAMALQAAVSCIQEKGIAIVTSEPDLTLKSQVWNKLNDTDVALAIVEPRTTDQVSQAMLCLFSNGVPAVPRSGGHSYGGYSVLPTAVTIDLTNMISIKLNPDDSATIQGGARLGAIYYEIWTQSRGQRGAVGGTCPAVGVGGHVLGGGIGFLNRMYGLACDQLVSLTMVNFKGDILQVSAEENPDLFWASCGGGGGNFGIVTEFKLNTVPVPPKVVHFSFKVAEDGVEYLLHLQNNVSKIADPRIGGLQVNPQPNQSVSNEGLFLGTSSEFESVLQSSQLSSWAKSLKKTEMTWIESAVVFAGSYMGNRRAPEDMMDIDYMETIGRSYFNLNSLYVFESNKLPASAFQDMFTWVQNNPGGFVEIGLLGVNGQVSKINPADTAYDYRDAIYSIQYGNEWSKPDLSSDLISQTQLLTSKLDKYFQTNTPPRVINYLDVQTPSMVGYYGSNLPYLRSIKAKYDPLNYFSWALSIPPSNGTTDSEPSSSPQQSPSEPSRQYTSQQMGSLHLICVAIPWVVISLHHL